MGIDFGRVILEERARSTYENALFSRQLVSSVGDDQWVLITSAWHMPRAFGAFRKAGWAIIPYPVDFRTDGHYNMTPAFDLTKGLGLLSLALKEWGALAYYRLRGWSDALFPASQDRADKL
ncbi:MAG: YdcF family protein [Deltaproteobacteria bacterium]|nr:YdcF family protein [Deltaproteobacteria bacterium]